MAYRRGYTIVPKTDEDLAEDKRKGKTNASKYKREMFTTTEAFLFIEGAEKIWYKKLSEQTHAGVIGNSFTIKGSYDEALRPIEDRAS